MTRPEDPLRLFEDPDAPANVGEALRAARARAPNPAQLSAMAGALGFVLPPPVPPSVAPPPAVPPASSLALAKVIAGLGGAGAVVAVVTTAIVYTQSAPPPSPPRPRPAVHERLPDEEPELLPSSMDVPRDEGVVPFDPSPARHRHDAPAAPSAPPAPATAPMPENPYDESRLWEEAALVQRAESLLARDPAGALRLTEERRRRFPEGALDQEAEVVAIDALLRLGRRDTAEARARTFEAAHSGSLHARRIRRLLDQSR